MQSQTAIYSLLSYTIGQLTNAQKFELFETIETESKYYGDKLNYTYENWIDAEGIEWLECTIRDVTTFKFHY